MVSSKSSQVASKRAATSVLAYPFTRLNQAILGISLRVGGTKAKEVERFLKFAAVGIMGAIIDFGVLNLLQATVLEPEGSNVKPKVALATGIAFILAVFSNFIWNRFWTYPDSRTRSIRQQWTQFFVVSLVGLAFRLVWVRLLFSPFGDIGTDALHSLGLVESLTEAGTTKVGTNIAQFFAVWIVMVWNFFVNRYWTYNDVE